MNWEAIVAIGLFCAAFGALLYVPARWWAKRKLAKAPPGSDARRQVTTAGLAFTTLIVGMLLMGLLQGRLAPETAFGRFVGTSAGKLVFFVGMGGLASVVAVVLERLGFTLFREPESDDSK